MKSFKLIALAVATMLLVAPQSAKAQSDLLGKASNLLNTASALTSGSGASAGSALLGLYSQFKVDGKLDMTNATNISNVITLVQSIKGLKGATAQTNTSGFLSGLISGSKNLVNNANSVPVLGALTSLANTDTNSLTSALTSQVAKTAATNAAQSMASKLLGKLAGANDAATDTAADVASKASQATSILSGLFGVLGK